MNKAVIIWSVLILIVATGYIAFSISVGDEAMQNNKNMANLTAALETSEGNIIVEFYPADAPNTVANFINLAQKGFFDGLSFHRVIPGFMIQGGDPLCGKSGADDEGACGTGGPGYAFEDEIDANTVSYKNGYEKGVLAMANSGVNTNGSQFFIMVNNVPLQHNYTIFGRIVSGQEVADKISLLPRDERDRPLAPVIINRVVVK